MFRYCLILFVICYSFGAFAQKHVFQIGIGANNVQVPDHSLGFSANTKYLYHTKFNTVFGAGFSYDDQPAFLDIMNFRSVKSRTYSALAGVYYRDGNVDLRLLTGLSFIESTYASDQTYSMSYGKGISPLFNVFYDQIPYNSWSIPLEGQVFMNIGENGNGLMLSYARHISTIRPYNVFTISYQALIKLLNRKTAL